MQMILLCCYVALTHEGCDIGAIKKRVWKTTPKINCLSFTTASSATCTMVVVLEKVDLHKVYSFNNSTGIVNAKPICVTDNVDSSSSAVGSRSTGTY